MYIALSSTSPAHMFLSPRETDESTLIKSPQSFRQFADRYTSALIDTTLIIKTHQARLKTVLMMASENDSTLKAGFYHVADLAEALDHVLRKGGFQEKYRHIACKEFRDGIDYPMANATLVADINAYLDKRG